MDRAQEVTLPFERRARAAGTTKYPTRAMIRFAWTGVTSFSGFPLRLSLLAGVVLTTAGFLYFLVAAYYALVLRITAPGWTSLVFLQVLFSGATLLAIGLVGDYIARIYDEAKGRPLYVVNTAANIPLAEQTIERAVILPPRPEADARAPARERKIS
jgi:dolichol-phosphate mannosyltransferase